MRPTTIATVALASAFASAASANTIFFESFESLSTPQFTTVAAPSTFVTSEATWTVESGTIDYANANARPEGNPIDGDILIDTYGNSAGTFSTELATAAGTQYELVFLYARNSNASFANLDIEVESSSSAVLSDSIAHTTDAFDLFTFSSTFVADASVATLRFSAFGSNNNFAGIVIDAIRVSVVPAPATAFLSLAGVAMISQRRR
ncbi:MAG: DUF642 domain-containing protein [Planctomycetota bacterium]